MGQGLRPLNLKRRYRTHLCVPGSSPELIRQAADSAADAVCLDLAGTVAPVEEKRARLGVIEALATIDWACRGKAVSVRVNGPDSARLADDIRAVVAEAGDALDTIVVPNIDCARQLDDVSAMLIAAERAEGVTNLIGLEAQVSPATAIMNAATIARTGGRLEAMHLDECHEDYTALSYLVLACRAYGLRVLDGPYTALTDIAGLRAAAARAASLGADGAWAIHPSQLNALIDAFGSDAPRQRDAALNAA